MSTDAHLTWRTCPTCGDFVPSARDACRKCGDAGSTAPEPPIPPVAPAPTASPLAPDPPGAMPPPPAPPVAPPAPPRWQNPYAQPEPPMEAEAPAPAAPPAPAVKWQNPYAQPEPPTEAATEPEAPVAPVAPAVRWQNPYAEGGPGYARPAARVTAPAPPGAGGWGPPPAGGELLPPAPPNGGGARGRSNGFRREDLIAVAVVVVVALVAIGLSNTVFKSSDYPSSWDPRLGDLPATVAHLRGLQFEHPVPVKYEPAEHFKHRIGSSKPSPAARRAAQRASESLRAMGLVSGKADLLAAARKSSAERVLAYYDPDRKEIVIRGGTTHLDVAHRVVLAHELTHVLQDQHFDLNAMEDAVRKAPGQSADALRAVVEGDATRIEDKYVTQLSAHDRAVYRASERKGAQAADDATADVPAVITLLQSAPYAYGPLALQVVTADGGNKAVDRVFEHGVFTQKLFVEPTTSFSEPAPEPIAAPAATRGEKTIGRPDEIGAFDLYVQLASRIDAADALEAASTWSGGRMRTVRAAGRTCVRGVVTTGSRADADALARDLTLWAGALPAGTATVERAGRLVRFRSCDPGDASTLTSPDVAVQRAGNLLGAHNELEVELVRETRSAGVPLHVVQCAALGYVRAPAIASLLSQPEDQVSPEAVGKAIQDATPAVQQACGV